MALALAATPLRPRPGRAAAIAGAVVAGGGAAVVGWGWRSLGPAATPFPRPRDSGRLVVEGPYAHVRHPIYAGGLAFFAGLALATSLTALVPVAALALLWRRKAALEEAWLEERYPEYAAYRARVRGRFLPRAFAR